MNAKMKKNKEYKKSEIGKPKHVTYVKALTFIIPALIVLYLVNVNFLIPREFNYFYDIGEKDYLSPASRISVSKDSVNLTSNLVYFNIPVPRNSETLDIQVKFKGPETLVKLGARDREEWHYFWKTIYNPSLEFLEGKEISSGIYRINDALSDNPNEFLNQEGIVIGSTIPLSPISTELNYTESNFTINTSLRGSHVFYLYLKDSLRLNLKKQDLNWYNGSDELTATLSNSSGDLIQAITFPDDGIVAIDKSRARIIEGIMIQQNLTEGVYKLEFSDFDGLIRQFDFNTGKVVVVDKVYLADSDIFPVEQKPSKIYTSFSRNSELSAKTWHTQGLQELKIENKILRIDEITNASTIVLAKGTYEISSEKNDIIIEVPSYFSFTQESYFEPFINKIVSVNNDPEWIESNLDYLVLEPVSIRKEDGWNVASVSFSLKDKYLKNNELSMVFNIPEMTEESEFQISVDWINTTIYKPSIFGGER